MQVGYNTGQLVPAVQADAGRWLPGARLKLIACAVHRASRPVLRQMASHCTAGTARGAMSCAAVMAVDAIYTLQYEASGAYLYNALRCKEPEAQACNEFSCNSIAGSARIACRGTGA